MIRKKLAVLLTAGLLISAIGTAPVFATERPACNPLCTVESCTQLGEHRHASCDVADCPQTGTHQHGTSHRGGGHGRGHRASGRHHI